MSKQQSIASTSTAVAEYNCKICPHPDTLEMVQCDKCDSWYHFQCVQVDATIEDASWTCISCRNANLPPSNNEPKPVAHMEPARSQASSTRSAKTRQRLLQQLEEEKRLRDKSNEIYLQKKYQVLAETEDSEEEEVENRGKSVFVDRRQFTQEWLGNANSTAVKKPNSDAPRPFISLGAAQKQPDPVPLELNQPTTAHVPSTNVREQTHDLTNAQLATRNAIPKELPTFNGYPDEWPVFISSFEHSTQIAGYSNAENLVRLQRCLRGKAMLAVKDHLLLPNMVPDVIKTLRMLYGRPEHILQAMIAKVKSQVPPRADKMETLIDYALAIRNVVATMDACHMTAHLNNPMLLQEFVEKLTPHLLLNWATYSKNLPSVTLKIFSDWLYEIAEAACSVTTLSISNPTEKRTNRRSNYLCTHATIPPRDENGNCYLSQQNKCCVCKDTHPVNTCQHFQTMGRSERWNIVRQNNLCPKCLGKHPRSRCSVISPCGVGGCTLKHHRMLHNYVTVSTTNTGITSTVGYHTNSANSGLSDVLFQIIPVTLYGTNKSIDTFALLDGGSSLTLMDEELACKLELPGKSEELWLRWTADTTRVESDSRTVSLAISGRQKGCNRYQIQDVRTVSSLNLPTQSLCSRTLKDRYPFLADLPIPSYTNAQPRIIIGMDYWKLGVPSKVVEGSWTQPMALKTRLGWSVQGPEGGPKFKIHNNNCSLNIHKHISDRDLHQLVESYFSIEDIGVRIPAQQMVSVEEKRAMSILENTCTRVDGRFEVGLLWKWDEFVMPNSYPMALRRLQYLERKMTNDMKLRAVLDEQISNLLQKGYAKKLGPKETKATEGDRAWYLPVFTVKNPNKPSKVRLVWDAAAQCNGSSLNDFLLKGPDQLVPITTVLYGFRCGKVAICGDIAEMFHQVRIREADRKAQRFLWSETHDSKNPDVFEMQVMTFGAKCSPCIAHYVKNNNAMRFNDTKPRAVEAILEHHYVDDFIDSVDTVEEAIQLARDVKYIHADTGFHIRNWLSNSNAVETAMQTEGELVQSKAFGLNVTNLTTTDKILGMHWCKAADVFTYKLKFPRVDRDVLSEDGVPPSKREILKILMAIYDPMGFLSHFLVFVKILLQDVWRTEIGWDECLPPNLIKRWLQWIKLLPRVTEVRIPRCYSLFLRAPGASVQVHTFVDASENAYAAVSYFRIQYMNNIHTTIVSAKTKVAPRRPLSIPRLELQAAVLGLRLANSICAAHKFPIVQRFFWTDSRTTLVWYRMDPRKFQQFVMHRVGEILETSNLSEWRWVPTNLNVADKATKWTSDIDWMETNEWFKGPTFLRESPCNWPKMPTLDNTNKEEFRPHLLHITEVKVVGKLIDEDRFSTWTRLLRTLAYVFMYVDKLRGVEGTHMRLGKSVVISSSAISRAQAFLFRQAQLAVYSSEISELNKARLGQMPRLSRNSPLYKLSPFVDERDILRMKGRTLFAECIDMECKNPIILPKSHRITYLIVDYYHRKFHHCNHETVLNEIKQLFYIANLRVLLKSVRRSCQTCKIKYAFPRIPEMGNLPRARLSAFSRPFSFVGVDYFGPLQVTVGRRSEKRWGAIFTCLTVRAVHIELVNSLTTDSCIMCLRNFVARRGIPREIYSDNGTNFRGTERVLREEIKKVDMGRVANEFASADMEWKFNPPAAPHMGGAWERLVRSIKTVLYEVLPYRKTNEETLRNALIEVEYIINSRPLTFVSLESEDDDTLTPNHFLLGTSNGSKPPCDPNMISLRMNWRQAQVIADMFWKKWVKAFLPVLNRRSKWFEKVKPLAKGDLVVIVDESLPRNCWPKGIIVETVLAMDGQVRRATVQTSGGIFERPASKLAVLDVEGAIESKADKEP